MWMESIYRDAPVRIGRVRSGLEGVYVRAGMRSGKASGLEGARFDPLAGAGLSSPSMAGHCPATGIVVKCVPPCA